MLLLITNNNRMAEESPHPLAFKQLTHNFHTEMLEARWLVQLWSMSELDVLIDILYEKEEKQDCGSIIVQENDEFHCLEIIIPKSLQ